MTSKPCLTGHYTPVADEITAVGLRRSWAAALRARPAALLAN
ncbi:hypothetical protein ABIA33_003753 [Streptacidiphilus sp. MAP12-16]